jgi:uncharacterized Fe-S cluster-containing radical SAM superfamily protein
MTSQNHLIDTARFAKLLRDKAIDVVNGKVLISRIAGTTQEADLAVPPICDGYARVRHFKMATAQNWPPNPLPILPASFALNISPSPDVMEAIVFQNAACAWRCWYCFVPEKLLNADPRESSWLTGNDLVNHYLSLQDPPLVIDLSGGSPDLVPEWTVWMMRALRNAGLADKTYLWGDDNLSTQYLFEELSTEDLDLLQQYPNYGRVCCIKGFDRRSFSFNTRAAPKDFDMQFTILRRVLELNIDVYGYVTLTAPNSDGLRSGISALLDRLQVIDPLFPLRIVPLQIRHFTPVEPRLTERQDLSDSLRVQEEAICYWNEEIANRFDVGQRELPIHQVPLKAEPRAHER